MGCIVHQLNTTMKHSIGNDDSEIAMIRTDISSVKSIVRIFKQSVISNRLPIGIRLIQAAETMFGTYFTVAERFINLSQYVKDIVNEPGREKAKELFDSLVCKLEESSALLFPALTYYELVILSLMFSSQYGKCKR